MKRPELICPLCDSKGCPLFCKRADAGSGPRHYFKCPVCLLIFLSPEERLSFADEKKHYGFHCNDSANADYLNFLSRLVDPLSQRLKAGAEGLDFGCGPEPAMSGIFKRKGFKQDSYDPLYFPDSSLLNRKYDFVTCCETIEHFFEPGKEWIRLDGVLKPRGFLGIMTGILEDESAFASWWYPRDPTHVCFYQKETFKWIAKKTGWQLEFPAVNITIFQKG